MKLNGTAAEALRQINEKEYCQKYLADNKRIILIGAAFDKKSRNIENWQTALIN